MASCPLLFFWICPIYQKRRDQKDDNVGEYCTLSINPHGSIQHYSHLAPVSHSHLRFLAITSFPIKPNVLREAELVSSISLVVSQLREFKMCSYRCRTAGSEWLATFQTNIQLKATPALKDNVVPNKEKQPNQPPKCLNPPPEVGIT